MALIAPTSDRPHSERHVPLADGGRQFHAVISIIGATTGLIHAVRLAAAAHLRRSLEARSPVSQAEHALDARVLGLQRPARVFELRGFPLQAVRLLGQCAPPALRHGRTDGHTLQGTAVWTAGAASELRQRTVARNANVNVWRSPCALVRSKCAQRACPPYVRTPSSLQRDSGHLACGNPWLCLTRCAAPFGAQTLRHC